MQTVLPLCTAKYVLSNFFLDSDAANFNPPSKIAFHATVPSSVHNIQKYFSLKTHHNDLVAAPMKRSESSAESIETSLYLLPSRRSGRRWTETGAKREEEPPPGRMQQWRRKSDEREEKRGREVGGAAVRLNSDKRDMIVVMRRISREWLRGGGVKEAK